MIKSLNNAAVGPQRFVQILFAFAALVLVVGLTVMFLMNSHIQDMQKIADRKASQVGSNEQVAHRYQQTLDDYNAIMAQTHHLESSVSAKAYVPTLLKQLQALATSTHLTVTAVRPGLITAPTPPAKNSSGGETSDVAAKKALPPPYDTIDISVDVTGTYVDTVSFLYNLTRFPKIVSVASVQMHPGAQDSTAGAHSDPVLTTSLHLTAFVFHQDKDGDKAQSGAMPASVAFSPSDAQPPTSVPAGSSAADSSINSMTNAAAHAAGKAIGASKAAQQRSEVGIETL